MFLLFLAIVCLLMCVKRKGKQPDYVKLACVDSDSAIVLTVSGNDNVCMPHNKFMYTT